MFDNSLVQQKPGNAPNQRRDDSKADFWAVYKPIGLISGFRLEYLHTTLSRVDSTQAKWPQFPFAPLQAAVFAFAFCATGPPLALTRVEDWADPQCPRPD
jgi:hypothetical protein